MCVCLLACVRCIFNYINHERVQCQLQRLAAHTCGGLGAGARREGVEYPTSEELSCVKDDLVRTLNGSRQINYLHTALMDARDTG